MPDTGVALEARVQRLFLAQGIFAERSLYPSADVAHRLLATDIDVLVSEYSSGFHLTRRHAECKSGRRVSTLDRVLWLNGVRSMLAADASYLVIASFDEDAADFARSLGIDVMTVKQLETWEKALSIPGDRWPNRSDFTLIEPIKKQSNDLGKQKNASNDQKCVRQAIQFVEIDSWREFGYGRFNRLLRLLVELSHTAQETRRPDPSNMNRRYVASALLVRLCQYLLAVCHDVSRVPVSDLHTYVLNRSLFGDQDPIRARGLVQDTVDWMSQALKNRGMVLPPEVDSNRLFQPPGYSEGLISLIEKLLASPNEAKYLPIAMETEQFAKAQDTELFPRLRSAWSAGRGLASLVKGFAIASLGIDASLLTPLREELLVRPAAVQSVEDESKDSSMVQNELSFLDPLADESTAGAVQNSES